MAERRKPPSQATRPSGSTLSSSDKPLTTEAPPDPKPPRERARPVATGSITVPSLGDIPEPVEPLPPTPAGKDLLTEYVAGSGYTWYGQLIRALPPVIDDLTADFGDDLYDRMLVDPQVAACITILKAAILEDGVHLKPAIDNEMDPDYPLAVEIHEEAEAMLDDMLDPLSDSLWDMLSAVALGNRVAEIKWDYRPRASRPKLPPMMPPPGEEDEEEAEEPPKEEVAADEEAVAEGQVLPPGAPGAAPANGRPGSPPQQPAKPKQRRGLFAENPFAPRPRQQPKPQDLQDQLDLLLQQLDQLQGQLNKQTQQQEQPQQEQPQQEEEEQPQDQAEQVRQAPPKARTPQQIGQHPPPPGQFRPQPPGGKFPPPSGGAFPPGRPTDEQIATGDPPGPAMATDRGDLINVVSLKVKPRRATAFVIDAFMNVIGLLGRPPGFPSPFLGSWLVDATDPPANMIPRSRFAVLTYRPKDGDPRGTSILRAAYEPWWRKRQVFPEYLKYLTQFAGPSLWGTTPEDSLPQPQLDQNGQPVPGAPMLSPETVLATALQQLRNGTAGAFPFGTMINAVPVQSSTGTNPFLSAVSEANVEITKTILTQQLATEEAVHQTRAAAQVHENVLDTIIRQGKQSVVRMIARDVLRQWTIYNWGEEAVRLVPKPSLGLVEEQDRGNLMRSIAALSSTAYLAPSQYQAIDEMLGLPVRTAEEVPPSPQERAALAMKIASGQGGGPMPGEPEPEEDEEEKEEDEDKAPNGRPGFPFMPRAKPKPPKAPPAVVPPPIPQIPRFGRASMAAEPSAGARDGVTGAVPTTLPPDPVKTPVYSGVDRWTMAELWARGVPEEYARLLRAPVLPGPARPERKNGEVHKS